MQYLILGISLLLQNSFLPPGQWIDLTYSYSEDSIYWPTAEAFKLEVVSHQYTDKGYFYAANNFCTAEHGGTHLDAPIHFAEGRMSTEQIPLDRLIGEAVVVDVSEAALKNPDYQVSVEDFQRFEAAQGRLPEGAIVLVRTGYGRFWPDAKKYLGTTKRGEAALPELHFPGLHPDLARWLTTQRNIKSIGIDTASIDYGQSQTYGSHQILYKQNIPAFENVANLDHLPTQGALVVALPMKIKGGSGGPLRIVAFVESRGSQ